MPTNTTTGRNVLAGVACVLRRLAIRFGRGRQQDGEGPASWRGRIPVPSNCCRGRAMLKNVDIVGQTTALCDQCLPKVGSVRHAENRTHRTPKKGACHIMARAA